MRPGSRIGVRVAVTTGTAGYRVPVGGDIQAADEIAVTVGIATGLGNRIVTGHRAGADIGLIQLAITSDNPLDIEITPIDDQCSFFTIRVKINK